MLNSFLQ
jgi:hypothetical protein